MKASGEVPEKKWTVLRAVSTQSYVSAVIRPEGRWQSIERFIAPRIRTSRHQW